METRACVLHSEKERDLRIENVPVAEMGDDQVLVKIGAGGICGSDLHYYLDGGFGVVRLKENFIPGHEVAGTVEAVGAKVTKVKPGDRIALNPSRPCGHCKFCQAGEHQHCVDMWFYGSAMRFPHSQGAFRERMVVGEFQCEPVGDTVSLGEAACYAGALEVVAVDLHDAALKVATEMGATRTLNVSEGPGLKADEFTAEKGYFDVAIECTGAAPVIRDLLSVVRPRGYIVQVGQTGDVAIPINAIVGKEITMVGGFRFHGEYALAARLIKEGRINVKPIITAALPFERAVEAFELAADRKSNMKVQLTF